MSRDPGVVRAELDAELAKLPTEPKPDMGKIIQLGIEAGWAATVRSESYAEGVGQEEIGMVLMSTGLIPTFTLDNDVLKHAILGGPIGYTLGPWLAVVNAMTEWQSNHHFVWPKTPTTPT